MMLKVTVAAMSLLAGTVLYAQETSKNGRIGINVEPNATLDIQAISDDKAKGLLIPRINNTEIKSITPNLTAEQHSMLAFFTETFPVADRTGAYILVAEPGFYYWNHTNTRWERLIVDLRMLGDNNHITQDAGVGGTGTSAGTGSHNVALGQGTLNAITTGTHNFAIGENALNKVTKATHNIAIGSAASRDLIEGESTIAIGQNALRVNTANHNIGIGSHALLRSTTGTNNTALGSNALRSNSTGGNNIAIGTNALGNDANNNRNTGSYNVAVGSNSLFANNTGTRNFGLGESALKGNTTGSSNIALGVNAMAQLETGNYNIAMGDLALEQLSGDNKNHNIAIGYNAGLSGVNTIGGGVIILGTNATANTDTSFKNIYLDTTKTNNAVALGNFVDVSKIKSNTVVIGNDKATGNTDGGTNVGIGVYEPKAKLDVNGGIKVGNAPGVCNDETRGVIRYNTTEGNFEGCTASGWKILNN